MVISLLTSFGIVGLSFFDSGFLQTTVDAITKLDFPNILLRIMLSFMLFAGAIHIDIKVLDKEKIPVIIFSTFGVLISTFIIGILMFFLLQLFGLSINFIYCLLFGVLISPTDPIAVLGILKNAKIPKSLEMKITGESLFNDGVAVVIFVTIYEITKSGLQDLDVSNVFIFFMHEAGGGILFGFILGYTGYLLLKSIDNYKVEVMITLAMVMGGYSLAHFLHVSGPLAMVVAGIIIGNRGKKYAMSETTREYLDKFWELIDEILNAILFILIGLEILIIKKDINFIEIGLITIILVLFSRYLSLGISILIMKFKRTFPKNTIWVLTWGGLRGGISVALALSLTNTMQKELFVTVTYIVVLFSIIVQGLTMGKFVKRLKLSDD
jgi:monovalent cation:H+ antiporter, CPA1 family